MSVDRVWWFTQNEPPFLLTAISLVLFTLSGFFNVLLFTITRPTLIPRPATDAFEPSLRIRQVTTVSTFLDLTRSDSADVSGTTHKVDPQASEVPDELKDDEADVKVADV